MSGCGQDIANAFLSLVDSDFGTQNPWGYAIESLCHAEAGDRESALRLASSEAISTRALWLALDIGAHFGMGAEGWRCVLRALVKPPGERQGQRKQRQAVYREALDRAVVAADVTPHEFFSLLPPKGNVNFFLPYIQRSLQRHDAELELRELMKRT